MLLQANQRQVSILRDWAMFCGNIQILVVQTNAYFSFSMNFTRSILVIDSLIDESASPIISWRFLWTCLTATVRQNSDSTKCVIPVCDTPVSLSLWNTFHPTFRNLKTPYDVLLAMGFCCASVDWYVKLAHKPNSQSSSLFDLIHVFNVASTLASSRTDVLLPLRCFKCISPNTFLKTPKSNRLDSTYEPTRKITSWLWP